MHSFPLFVEDEERGVTYHCSVTAHIDADPGGRWTPPYTSFEVDLVTVSLVEIHHGETSHAVKPTDADQQRAYDLLDIEACRDAFDEHDRMLFDQRVDQIREAAQA